MSQDRAADERDLAKLEEILQFAARVRELDKSPRWKSDLEGVMDDHGAAVDAVYARLFEMLDIRQSRGAARCRIEAQRRFEEATQSFIGQGPTTNSPAVLQDAVESTIEELEL